MRRAAVLLLLSASTAHAHDLYLAHDNHLDYAAQSTPAEQDQLLLEELDFYLAQIAATAGNPPPLQARYNLDSWWALKLYEERRTPEEFAALIEAMLSGHLSVPINPFIELYGAMPAEAAIRASYYPGRIERQHFGVLFPTAVSTDSHGAPWGLASLWAGCGARWAWKGICGCSNGTFTGERTDEVFFWIGADGRRLLMKWYLPSGNFGGLAEARDILSESTAEAAIARYSVRPPLLPATGLFGAGGTDLEYRSDFVPLAEAFNASHANDRIVVSNQHDYFTAVERSGVALPEHRGSYGIDQDLRAASLSQSTGSLRRAMERLRTLEALAAVLHGEDPSLWAREQPAIEAGMNDLFKYFEHNFDDAAQKQAWAATLPAVVEDGIARLTERFAARFAPSTQDRFAVFNPLGFTRTDYVDVPLAGSDPITVTDLISLQAVPAQRRDGVLRVLVRDLPSYAYRIYRYERRVPPSMPNAGVISATQIANEHTLLNVGDRGQISEWLDLQGVLVDVPRDFVGLNNFGIDSESVLRIDEWTGPVSATMRVEIGGAVPRRTRITIFTDIPRIEIENEILANVTGEHFYRFDALNESSVTYVDELNTEVRLGMDFLPGARTDYFGLGHYVRFQTDDYSLTLSNRDAFAMTSPAGKLGEVSILAAGNPGNTAITDQGGATRFTNDFALIPLRGRYSPGFSQQAALAHQNKLLPIMLSKTSSGTESSIERSYLSLDWPQVVITSFKPAEEGERGWVVRMRETLGLQLSADLDPRPLNVTEAWATSLNETDEEQLSIAGHAVDVPLMPYETRTVRFLAGLPQPQPDAGWPDARPGHDVRPGGDFEIGPRDADAIEPDEDAGASIDAEMITGPEREAPGCGCRASRGETSSTAMMVVLVLLALTRRRSIPKKNPLSWQRKQRS